ncbi:phospho-N-acetylmuramoyl-pentapeptide-transferase [Kyrpidia spormannii]|uniref:Phospho-N-acetylmuramoyl-pentapeptide undecaprenyl phosphate (C55P) transferase n=1 Tax=Kyrpidia spormannii TaxID=2055160 RepID=A0ACA8Z8I5_9BACL|nr:phospho-N-acetylmuramoyl-pentapeptide-transferase [Kyrpidia spormannii]CAB3391786.1 phospho-N-acetylmuramoyl-pentapeptide undecaprenyl phosphate (C55P) transferase [Kyrpidia spormannii]
MMQAVWLTAGTAFVVAVLLGPLFIPVLRRLKIGQSIREEGPVSHKKKSGTPTMGGTIILLATAVTVWQFAGRSPAALLAIGATLAFGLIGFIDDYIKVVKRRNLGLTARQKLLVQGAVAVLFFLALARFHGFSFDVYIPLVGVTWHLGGLYLPFLALVLIGTSNAVNLTDGLDGLAAGTAAIALGTYVVVAWWNSQYDLVVFCAAMMGALLGFLVFNAHPARVFMGDTGSLAIGAALASAAVLTKTEFWLILIGGVFVAEALSVMIQVFAFQTFGRRVFRMSPLHHHFELGGWSEWRVVSTFWAVGLCLSAGALVLYARG